MAVLAVAKVGRGFRVTISKDVRELLELEEGDGLLFFKTEGWMKRICLKELFALTKRRKFRIETNACVLSQILLVMFFCVIARAQLFKV